jgi:hypothetical protein
MPIHDWSRVYAGAFHHFHFQWIAALSNALNSGLLPADYYAMAQQVSGPAVPDVLTLQSVNGHADQASGEPIAGASAVAVAPPRVTFRDTIEPDVYVQRQRSIVVRHSSDDRVVALIEVVSAGNKASNREFRALVDKAIDILERGYHLLLVDLDAPTVRDPDGIHGAIFAEVGGKTNPSPAGNPLTLVAYDAGPPLEAYLERVAVGDPLADMPLFLAPGWYVYAPLEATYEVAWRGTPRRVRELVERPPASS